MLDRDRLRLIKQFLQSAIALLYAALKLLPNRESNTDNDYSNKQTVDDKAYSDNRLSSTRFLTQIDTYGKSPAPVKIDRSECFIHPLASGRVGAQTKTSRELIVNPYGYATLLVNQAYLSADVTVKERFAARVQLLKLLGKKFTTEIGEKLTNRDLATVLNVCSQIAIAVEND